MGHPGWASGAAPAQRAGSRRQRSAWRHTGALGRCLLALCALAVPSGELYAQAATASASCAPPARSGAGSGPARSNAEGATAEKAEKIAALYQSFECHFARKEYAACLPYLEQACQLTDSPRCLLNLGAVHHALMHCQLARSYYQQYLDRSPYDEDVGAARSALEELERACPQRERAQQEVGGAAAAAAPVGLAAGSGPADPGVVAPLAAPLDGLELQPGPLPQPAPADSATPSAPLGIQLASAGVDTRTSARGEDRWQAWSLLGAGAASLTATIVLAAHGARAERDYEARARLLPPPMRSTDGELRAIDARGERSNQLALAFGVLSGLLTGAGATLWLMDLGHEESAPGLSLQLSPDGTALSSYRGRF